MPDYPEELRAGVQRMIDAGESEQNIAAAIAAYKQRQQTQEPTQAAQDPSGGLAAADAAVLLGVRGLPGAIRTGAGFAAEHPRLVQRVINTGMRGAAAGLGGAAFGPGGAVTGALVGGGLTPTQATIRSVAGKLAGEPAPVAESAGRALGIQNYIKSTSGLNIKPTDILERPMGLPAGEAYAEAQGRGILKILGPNGEVVAGPTAAAPAEASARVAPKVATKFLGGALRLLGTLANAQGMMAAERDVNQRLANDPFVKELARRALMRKLGYSGSRTSDIQLQPEQAR